MPNPNRKEKGNYYSRNNEMKLTNFRKFHEMKRGKNKQYPQSNPSD